MLLSALPALAQTQPVRVVNANNVTATALYMRAVGQEAWGDNLLGRLFLPPGGFFSVQPGDGGGCQFDMRLVLRDGRETLRRNVDVCAQRAVSMAVLPTPGTGPAAPLAPDAPLERP
jgi:hypothetical protein